MKKRYVYACMRALAWLALPCWWACSDEVAEAPQAETDGLVLDINVSGTPAVSASTRAALDPNLNEAVVNRVDVFFLKGDAVEHYVHAPVVNGKATLATGRWQDTYRGTYDIYVVANKHDYDNPLTTEVETDLEWVTGRDQLLALTDTDVNVHKAQGEYDGTNRYDGKDFLMDGKVPSWDADAQDVVATINAELSHAAAKLVVNVTYDEAFLSPADGPKRNVVSVGKKLMHYVQDAKAVAEGGSIALVDVQGQADSDGFTTANVTSGNGTPQRTDKLYAYSYPNDWGSDVADRETYFLVNIPYMEEGSDLPKDNFYKVPVRVSGNAADLCLDRNKEYTVNVTIDRVGNEEIDTPAELKPTCSVKDWQPVYIPVDDTKPYYLMVNPKEIEMHNVADTTITFFSSSAITVTKTEDYFINKNGRQVNSRYRFEEKHDGGLSGKITIESQIPENVTARYITLQVTNNDGQKQIVHITQYPLEYISGVPGWYSARDDFDATWQDHEDGTRFDGLFSPPTVSNGVFSSKVHEGSSIYTYYAQLHFTVINNYYTIELGSEESDNPNNRMYLVQITSTSGDHIVARPVMDGTGDNIVTHSSDENNRLVSPTFMLASQLGTVYPAEWSTAQDHCKQYVEVVKYEDGSTKRLADWRLPTYAELQVIARYQYEQPEVMDEVLAGEEYWSAHENRYLKTANPNAANPSVGSSRTTCYIRCVRDVSPADLKEFREHGIR